MKNRHWWSPQGEDAQSADRRLERCDDVASLLTALFDGEATEEEARRARLHLLACQRCADIFANWSQTRQILRSEAVPAPPSTLMWRILAACRVAGYVRKPAAPAKPARTPDALSPIPPSLLKESILANTVGATRKAPPTPRWRRSPGAWTALAAPAMAIWFMALAWQNSAVQLSSQSRLASAPHTVTVSHPVNSKTSNMGLKPVSAPRPAVTAPKAAPIETVHAIAPVEHEAVVRHVSAPVRETREGRRTEVRHEVIEAAVERPVPAPVEQPAAVFASDRGMSPVRAALMEPVSHKKLTVRLASMADHDTPAPRPQRASFSPLTKSTIATLAKASGNMRASTPVEPVNTPLVIASTGDPDHGLDEVQSTVDDLRALYATDTSGSDGTELPS